MSKSLTFLVLAAFFTSSITAQNNQNIKNIFAKYGVDGCFVLYNQEADSSLIYNDKLSHTGYLPASTFKIPHALIALEEGLVSTSTDTIKWNGHEWSHAAWNKDQTLGSSLKYSCIWVYFGFAEQLGIDKYYDYVNAFDYGNKNLTGPPTRFWLVGDFKISAIQQVEFIKQFYNYKLPVHKENIDIIKNIILLEQTESYSFYGKTGGTDIGENEYIMWLVGFVETIDNVYFYALNFTTNDFNKNKQKRYDITKEVVEALQKINFAK